MLTPWVTRLLVANGVVFLLMAVGLLPFRWTVHHFGFRPDALLSHPWSPLTYMFVHGGFWHVLVNMLVLFFFGPPLERVWGGREFLRFYLVAGLGGAFFSLVLAPFIGSAPVVGASGAIYGVMLAFALRWPDARIYVWGILPVKARWFVAFIAAAAFLSTWSSLRNGGAGGVAHWAHLGGLVTGFVYLRQGSRVATWLDRAERALRRRWSGGETPRGDLSLSARERDRRRSASRDDRRGGRAGGGGVPTDTLDEVDRILDKIREEGLDSLDERERAFLDEVSRRYRK